MVGNSILSRMIQAPPCVWLKSEIPQNGSIPQKQFGEVFKMLDFSGTQIMAVRGKATLAQVHFAWSRSQKKMGVS